MVVVVVVGGGGHDLSICLPPPHSSFLSPGLNVSYESSGTQKKKKKKSYLTCIGSMLAICVFFWILNCRIKPAFDTEVFCFVVVSPALCTDWVLYRLRCFTQECLTLWIVRN